MMVFEKMVGEERSYAIVELGLPPRAITKDDFEAGALRIMQTQLDELGAALSAKSAEIAALKASEAAQKTALSTALDECEKLKTSSAEAAVRVIALEASQVQEQRWRAGSTAMANAAARAIADPALDATATVAVITQIVSEVLKPQVQRERESLIAQISELHRKLEAVAV